MVPISKYLICLIFIFLTIDLYVYRGIRVAIQGIALAKKKIIAYLYWSITCFTIGVLLIYSLFQVDYQNPFFRYFFLYFTFTNYVSKLFAVIFLLLDDLISVTKWSIYKVSTRTPHRAIQEDRKIPRSAFLQKTAILAAAVPVVTLGYGIVSGAHDYRLRSVRIALPNLPTSFDGLRIGQLSDIHSGSFFHKTAVRKGVALLVEQKPDIIFFTGDLVNSQTDEVEGYINVFNKVKAPLGVYATLGNHDYGDYRAWPSAEAKRKNFAAMLKAHELLEWDVLMNEHRIIEKNGDKLAVIGVENWGTGRFSKYGKLGQAYQGLEDIPAKLLLSHDPSHWDAEIRPHFKDIDITFSGHTHGFQFGIELGAFKWSPAQYSYKQWAGLYREENQYLYVNRGFGYIGYPGRVGILPELTIIELKKA
ncbi:MAG: metallophosphoesterase [Cytophagales bacterium]|nr:metallophosphoesterase [Cytophagales bacterium]